ncbi:SH3 beta-barrel fold-containing protein [Acinetobacter baumannii]
MSTLNLTNQGYTKLREYVKTVLSHGIHQVVFKKVNGNIRVMNASQDSDILVEREVVEFGTKRTHVDEALTTVTVLDTDLNEWRKIKLDNLIGLDGINIDTILKNAQVKIEEE